MIRLNTGDAFYVVMRKLHYPFRVGYTLVNPLLNIHLTELPIGPGIIIARVTKFSETFLFSQSCSKGNVIYIERLTTQLVMLAQDDIEVTND